eukprot:1148161-Pelagomonas_calceolata.AAC.13
MHAARLGKCSLSFFQSGWVSALEVSTMVASGRNGCVWGAVLSREKVKWDKLCDLLVGWKCLYVATEFESPCWKSMREEPIGDRLVMIKQRWRSGNGIVLLRRSNWLISWGTHHSTGNEMFRHCSGCPPVQALWFQRVLSVGQNKKKESLRKPKAAYIKERSLN